MVENELDNSELVELFPDYTNETWDVYLLYPPVRKRPERIKLVINHRLKYFDELEKKQRKHAGTECSLSKAKSPSTPHDRP